MDMEREMLKLLLSQRLKPILNQDTEATAIEVMDIARERLKLSQVTEAMDMVVMVMAEAMVVMVDTEAMEVMDMARERLKLSQDTEATDMVVMVMAEAMVVMVDTEAMEVMDMARGLLMLS